MPFFSIVSNKLKLPVFTTILVHFLVRFIFRYLFSFFLNSCGAFAQFFCSALCDFLQLIFCSLGLFVLKISSFLKCFCLWKLFCFSVVSNFEIFSKLWCFEDFCDFSKVLTNTLRLFSVFSAHHVVRFTAFIYHVRLVDGIFSILCDLLRRFFK